MRPELKEEVRRVDEEEDDCDTAGELQYAGILNEK